MIWVRSFYAHCPLNLYRQYSKVHVASMGPTWTPCWPHEPYNQIYTLQNVAMTGLIPNINTLVFGREQFSSTSFSPYQAPTFHAISSFRTRFFHRTCSSNNVITWTSLHFLSIALFGTNVNKIGSNTKKYLRKCVWIYRFINGDDFYQVATC